ncbi:hypothetical protein PFISCL1PPCAC_19673 [Pristionchus fissidentatus]|uniref:DEAD/DEAH box helicase domain-containing protein n=1 Tax=Pristionchus fissidentatus TaxID=1538716 RepID=A0AAV5W944_9BILA|nr:hypothetical protein PFISCL1PPCAC_19673 [Pristionchus fissidentatus]
MAPKKKKDGTTPSIIDAFRMVKKPPRPLHTNVFRTNEVIDISESQEEDIPGPSTTITPIVLAGNTVEPVLKWSPGMSNCVGKRASLSRRSLTPKLSDSYLIKLGCDVNQLKAIEVSTGSECSTDDVDILRSLLSANSSLVLPRRSIFILSTFILNWLRMFPTGRICICTSSEDWRNALIEECELIGMEKSSFSILSNSKIPSYSRVIIVTPGILHRVMSTDPLANQIRCVIFHISSSDPPTKLKITVNDMLMKKIPSRYIVIGGGGSKGGKGGAISRRQKMITNLNLTQWIEPREESFVKLIKPQLQYNVHISTWSETDNPFLVESIDQMDEALKELIDSSGCKSDLPSVSPRDLVFAPFHLLKERSAKLDELISVLILFSRLFSYGKESFDATMGDLISSCESVQLSLLSSPSFVRSLDTISRLSGVEHRKIRLIKETIQRAKNTTNGRSLRGLIVVEDQSLVSSISQSISIFCQVIEVDLFPLGSMQYPISHAFKLIETGGIVILSIEKEKGLSAFQLLAMSHLHFVISTSRRTAIKVDNPSMIDDWYVIIHEKEKFREMINEEEVVTVHERVDSAYALQNYPFNYERSLISLDMSAAVVRLSAERGRVYRWSEVSLTPSDRLLLTSQCLHWMDSSLPSSLSPSSLLWNESLHSSRPSSLSRRLVSLINTTFSPFPLPSVPSSHFPSVSPHLPSAPSHLPSTTSSNCICTPSDGEVFYSSIISSLSRLFP